MKLTKINCMAIALILMGASYSYALQDTISDNISTQVLLDSSAITGNFDVSGLFSQNSDKQVVIDSATVSFSLTDDGDLKYMTTTYSPAISGDRYYNGRYYMFQSSSQSGFIVTNTYLRTEYRQYMDAPEIVTIDMNNQSTTANTSYFSNSSTGSNILDGSEGYVTVYKYYHNETVIQSGYNGNASAQMTLDTDSIQYLMVNQAIEFTLSCGTNQDILFNSATMDIEYHLEDIPEPVAVPEPHTVMLLLSGIAMLVKKLRG